MTPRQRWTLLATVIGSGAVFLDGTVVNLALPRIGRELPSTVFGVLEGQTYVVSGYLAVLAALLILAGALSDRYGRRRVYAVGLASFAATSALCGFAPTLEWLVLFRLLQGAAGALLVPGGLSIITQTFDAGVERGRAFGIWASATSALGLLGPLVGGLLVDTVGWRVVFLINVPALALALWVVLRHIPESRDTKVRPFDWLGSAVAAIAVGGLSFGLVRGAKHDWQDTLAWISIALGTVALVVFPILMARRRDPLVPLALFRSRTFTTINLATFFIYGALYVTFSYQGILLQNVLGYTALAAGAVGIPVGICLTLLSTRVGAMAGRLGARRFLVVGPLLMAAALLWYARVPADSDPWLATLAEPATLIPPVDLLVDILPSILLFGFGIACIVAPLTNTLMGSIPERYSGLGSAMNNAIARVGQPLLGAIVFLAINATYYSTLATLAPDLDGRSAQVRSTFSPLNPPKGDPPSEQVEASRRASVDAFHQAMLVGAGLLVIGAGVSAYGLRDEKSGGATHAAEQRAVAA
jgi:EmrB/QacA subfamily drug resistance transporter